ncbi:MAG: holo-ACP synthase [Eubacterium sp.]|nr:holo-ACP synthase [Eubacterium sp.]
MRIGTDIIRIHRVERACENEHFRERVYTPAELEYCKSAQSFAGIYAAKEAYLKALGVGIERRLNTIEIDHDELGKPFIKGVENCDLSISHDGDTAIATVIMW